MIDACRPIWISEKMAGMELCGNGDNETSARFLGYTSHTYEFLIREEQEKLVLGGKQPLFYLIENTISHNRIR